MKRRLDFEPVFRICIGAVFAFLLVGCVGPLKTMYSANEEFAVAFADSSEGIRVQVEGYAWKLHNDTDYYSRAMIFVMMDGGRSFDDVLISVSSAKGFVFDSKVGFIDSIGVRRVIVDNQDFRRPRDSSALFRRLEQSFSEVVFDCDRVPVAPFDIRIKASSTGGEVIDSKYRVISTIKYRTHYLPLFATWFDK